MILRIGLRESLSDNIKRIAAGHIDEAIQMLEHPPDLEKSVHDARKHLKRLRALLRLVRACMSESAFKTEYSSFRKAGKQLAGLRDSYIILKTLDKTLSGTGKKFDPEQIEQFRKILKEHYERQIVNHRANDEAAGIVIILHDIRGHIDGWTFSGEGFDGIRQGLGETYRHGRRTIKSAVKDTSTEHLHAWRKYSECLRFQMDILRPLWKPVIGAYADSFHKLTDLAGDDHDFAVLAAELTDKPTGLNESLIRMLSAEIIRRRTRLQRQALQLGNLLYAEKPGAFVARIEKYWKGSFDK